MNEPVQNIPYILFSLFRIAPSSRGLPRWHSGKESICQCQKCRRLWFDPCIRKIPWRRKWSLAPAFLPGKSHGQKNLVGYSPWSCRRVRYNLATKQQQQQQSMQGRLVWTWNSIQFLFQKQQKVSKYSLSEKWKDEIYIA